MRGAAVRLAHRRLCYLCLLGASVAIAALAGCARGGEGAAPIVPEKVLEVIVRFKAGVADNFYYFVAIDADNDNGADGPLPVAAGPRWENGWGTGSFTHFVEYHLGQYNLYRSNLAPKLETPSAGINAVTGVPDTTDAGTHLLTVTGIDYGPAAVTGSGMIEAAQNTGFQSAGQITIGTDAQGRTVPGSVTYTPASTGGRLLTTDEQAAVDTLDAGGVALETDALDALGLTLTLGAPQAGTQTITIGQTVARIANAFTSNSTGAVTNTDATLNANSNVTTVTPPIPGATVTCGDFTLNGTATINLDTEVTATLIGPPYESAYPSGTTTIHFTIDVAALGANVQNISINVITTTELIYDPTITLPAQNVYDGLGHLGNRYITIDMDDFRSYSNGDGLFEEEGEGDNTLEGPATDEEKAAVDIVDWQVTLKRLR